MPLAGWLSLLRSVYLVFIIWVSNFYLVCVLIVLATVSTLYVSDCSEYKCSKLLGWHGHSDQGHSGYLYVSCCICMYWTVSCCIPQTNTYKYYCQIHTDTVVQWHIHIHTKYIHSSLLSVCIWVSDIYKYIQIQNCTFQYIQIRTCRYADEGAMTACTTICYCVPHTQAIATLFTVLARCCSIPINCHLNLKGRSGWNIFIFSLRPATALFHTSSLLPPGYSTLLSIIWLARE